MKIHPGALREIEVVVNMVARGEGTTSYVFRHGDQMIKLLVTDFGPAPPPVKCVCGALLQVFSFDREQHGDNCPRDFQPKE